MRQEVSTTAIILNDYFAFLLTIFGPIALLVAVGSVLFEVFGQEGGAVGFGFLLMAAAGVICIVAFVFLYRRIAYIARILEEGPRATATVTDINFFKDRGRVEYEYEFEGQPYATGTAIMKNDLTTAISPGDTLEVALDPADSSVAFVVCLYLG